MSDKIEVKVNDVLVWSQAASGAVVTPVPTPVPVPTTTPVPPATCQVIDARGWKAGNTSEQFRVMHGQAGVIVAYLFSAAQLRDGNPTKQGRIEFSETPPGVQFEISNIPCDMSMPIPIPTQPATWLVPARGWPASFGNRYPRLPYINQDHAGNPTWGANGFAILGNPDAAGNYYVNVKPAATGDYFLWYWKQ